MPTDENPYEPPERTNEASDSERGDEISSNQAAYNTVTDLVTGANVRWRDNLLQGVSILVCGVIGVAVGAIVASPDLVPGAIVGGFAGVVAGLFGSGIFLMVYRAVRHVRGKHD